MWKWRRISIAQQCGFRVMANSPKGEGRHLRLVWSAKPRMILLSKRTRCQKEPKRPPEDVGQMRQPTLGGRREIGIQREVLEHSHRAVAPRQVGAFVEWHLRALVGLAGVG